MHDGRISRMCESDGESNRTRDKAMIRSRAYGHMGRGPLNREGWWRKMVISWWRLDPRKQSTLVLMSQ